MAKKKLTLFFSSPNRRVNFIKSCSEEQLVFLQAHSEAIMLLKKAFDENDITITSPIRTFHFGIKRGENLSEILKNNKERNFKRDTYS